MRNLYALCDCNNFFVSCERVFRPDLRNAPVIVLSSNDGCVVSRSNEAKALGVPMGEPYFKIKPLVESRNIVVFSSNFSLYREFSNRVMEILAQYTDAIEIYSIDEAFLNLSIACVADPPAYLRGVRARVLKCTGIPMSIGLAPTKTLAKLAAERAKSAMKTTDIGGVFSLAESGETGNILADTPVGDVWGIGRKSAEMLVKFGVRSARDLRDKDEEWLRRKLSIRGLMTAWELRGISCIKLQAEETEQKSIQVTRSFAEKQRTLSELRKPVVANVVSAAARLRSKGLAAGVMSVYIRTSYHKKPFYANSAEIHFKTSTRGDSELIPAALACLEKIFRTGYDYAKSGVFLSDLSIAGNRQLGLFDDTNEVREKLRSEALSQAQDTINRVLGCRVVRPAILYDNKTNWNARSDKISKFTVEDINSLSLE